MPSALLGSHLPLSKSPVLWSGPSPPSPLPLCPSARCSGHTGLLLLLQQARPGPAPGPLPGLCPLPGVPFPHAVPPWSLPLAPRSRLCGKSSRGPPAGSPPRCVPWPPCLFLNSPHREPTLISCSLSVPPTDREPHEAGFWSVSFSVMSLGPRQVPGTQQVLNEHSPAAAWSRRPNAEPACAAAS